MVVVCSMAAMRFEWDENKNRQNLLKHDVRFETAALVFDDPCALTQIDQPSEGEERWVTLGAVDRGVGAFCRSYLAREARRRSYPHYFGAALDSAREEKI
jgi:uncharacterized DUF497 family protein